MNTLLYDHIADLVRKADHILLLTDVRIDGDTVGCTLGLYHVLSAMKKRVDVYSAKDIPSMYDFLPGFNVIRYDDEVLKQPSIDLMIVCDSSDGEHIPDILSKMVKKVPLVSFDHHGTNPRYGTVNCIDPNAASTADLLWRFLKSTKLPVNRNVAQCILAGICFDTQAFFSQNTTGTAVEASVELTKMGANLHEIVRHFFMNKSPAAMKLWGIALERLFYDDSFQAIATVIKPEDVKESSAKAEDIEGLTNFLNAVIDESHEVVVFYRETDEGDVKGGIRSRGRDVAKQAAEMYGGGGHKLAAGFKIKGAHMEKQGDKWVVVKDVNKTNA